MKINEVEQIVGITKKNIRFYEQQGLLSPNRNKENGYREYSESDVKTLEDIKLLRKIGLPLEEIKLMQTGNSTVADSMKRHLITLDREKNNLSQAQMFCSRLKNEDIMLSSLNSKALLEELEVLEQTGTLFKNKQKHDERSRDYIAPVIAALGMSFIMTAVIIFIIWAAKTDPSEAPPIWFLCIIIAVPLFVIAGVFLALLERIREIKKGEMEDAKKY